MKKHIDGLDFYDYFKSGAGAVLEQKESLNKINVFPVQDGDTGTNLVMTMNSIVDEAERSADFNVVIRSMSDVAFESARGNSGIIFASFIGGLSRACGNLKSVSMEDFGYGATLAAKEAYGAVSKPVEGTMLTVMSAWADYIGENHRNHHSFGELFDAAYEKAKKALEETPEKLEVLRKHKVVDSGAKGFVVFLEGINRFLMEIKETVTEKLHSSNDAESKGEKQMMKSSQPTIPYRYCTEFVLKGDVKKKEAIVKMLEMHGDSVVVTGNDRILKSHLHTNEPDLVSLELIKLGYQITKTKIDDMLLQTIVERKPKSKIGILTDSIADIHEELLLSEEIHVLALSLIADENIYLDKLSATQKNIAQILDHSMTYPSSSQPEVKQVEAKIDWMKSHYEEIIVLSVSKALSGTYSSFEKVVNRLKEDGYPIHLIDTKLNTSGQGMMVLKAAQMANRGESAQKIVQQIESEIARTDIYVSLDTFKYAVKSGRVPNKIGSIFMKLNAKPIMTLNRLGEGAAFGLAFSRKGIDKKILNLVKKIQTDTGIERYTIVHANNPELASRYAQICREILGVEPEYITPISAVTTIHSGLGSVAISLVRRG